MRKLLVLALVCSGLVLAGQTFEATSLDRESRLAAVTRILTGGGTEVAAGVQTTPVPAQLPVPSVSSTTAWVGTVVANVPSPAAETSVSPAATSSSPVPGIARAEMTPASGAASWPTVVITEGAPVVRPAAPAATKPATGKARYELVVSLQKELSRVGCYGGRIDGSWRMGSRRAMREFMERVNASLPIEDPDYILLTLLQAHPASTCGRDCPKGQMLANDGRCLPNAIVARASKKAEPVVTKQHAPSEGLVAWSTETLPAARPDPLPGRMSIGGPVPVADAGVSVAVRDQDADAAAPASKIGQQSLIGEGVEQRSAVPGRLTSKPSKRTSTKPSRPTKRYAVNYRSRNVQNLFMHPLGRM